MKTHIKSALFICLILGSSCQGLAQDAKPLNVAIFVHERVQLLDFTGPGEVFSDAHGSKGHLFNVYTVAATENEITSQGFLKVRPQYSIKNAPAPDILVIPGGDTNIPLANKEVVEWVSKVGKSAKYMMSVCTGVLLLAEAGILDGKKATTHYCCLDNLEKYSKVTVLRGVRYIDNGTVLTTEGISAGIDGALYLVQKIGGKEAALGTAKYMMYDWKPEQLNVVITE